MATYEDLCGPFAAPACWLLPAAERAIVEVSGPEAAEFLHRLCSQDVLGLADGAVSPCAVLNAKGKLVAICQLARVGERFFLETLAERFEALAELVERYHFTENLVITGRRDWVAGEVLGRLTSGQFGPEACAVQLREDGLVLLAGSRRGLSWLRAHGEASAVAAWGQQTGLTVIGAELREALRIASGELRVGLDSDERTLALEAEIDDHFHLNKGCYTGQEIVARVHTYGHLNRRLKLLKLATTAPIEVGTQVFEAGEDDVVVRVLSTVAVPEKDYSIGLGYVPEVFLEDPEPLALGSGDGPAVEVCAFDPIDS